jgi:hypothetical protein
MFGIFKSPEIKQNEFISAIENSTGWCRNFFYFNSKQVIDGIPVFSAEHKVLRIDITRLHGEGIPEYHNWRLSVYHYDQPDKIKFRMSSDDCGRKIHLAISSSKQFCLRDYNKWRARNGFPT